MATKILVTGGAGFIGSALIRYLISETEHQVVNVDKLTYAGNLRSLDAVSCSDRYRFEQVDIVDGAELHRVFREHQPDVVMHLAAESHVDRSLSGSAEFVQTNILGTHSLLEVSRAYVAEDENRKKGFRFHHVSTDEVYGDLVDPDALFTERTPYAPSSPYSASKASSDHLVRAWHRSYGLPVLITNCSNNYGPNQFPEKLIPLVILNALDGKPIPIYGDGQQIRDWLYVEDHVRALLAVLEKGSIGGTYNIGGHNERTSLHVVNSICSLLQELRPAAALDYKDLITFVDDRLGHDLRYAIDASKMERELEWVPYETFESGLRKTVEWYLDNMEWVSQVRSGEYREWVDQNYSYRAGVPKL